MGFVKIKPGIFTINWWLRDKSSRAWKNRTLFIPQFAEQGPHGAEPGNPYFLGQLGILGDGVPSQFSEPWSERVAGEGNGHRVGSGGEGFLRSSVVVRLLCPEKVTAGFLQRLRKTLGPNPEGLLLLDLTDQESDSGPPFLQGLLDGAIAQLGLKTNVPSRDKREEGLGVDLIPLPPLLGSPRATLLYVACPLALLLFLAVPALTLLVLCLRRRSRPMPPGPPEPAANNSLHPDAVHLIRNLTHGDLEHGLREDGVAPNMGLRPPRGLPKTDISNEERAKLNRLNSTPALPGPSL